MSSSRSPGFPGQPDFVTGLHQNGAGKNGQTQGLFLKNYWRGGRRRRSRTQIPPNLRALVDYGVASMMAALRFENPGINVRLPSHINPPFRSFQWTFDVYEAVPSPSILVVFNTVSFGGNTSVPEGVRGVLSSLDFWIEPGDIDALPDKSQLPRLTLFKNSQAVPGFDAVGPGLATWETFNDIAGAENNGMVFPGPKVVTPVTLEPGDVLVFAVVSPLAVPFPPNYYLRLQGWLYPIEVEADGIVGTLADRGGGMVVS